MAFNFTSVIKKGTKCYGGEIWDRNHIWKRLAPDHRRTTELSFILNESSIWRKNCSFDEGKKFDQDAHTCDSHALELRTIGGRPRLKRRRILRPYHDSNRFLCFVAFVRNHQGWSCSWHWKQCFTCFITTKIATLRANPHCKVMRISNYNFFDYVNRWFHFPFTDLQGHKLYRITVIHRRST